MGEIIKNVRLDRGNKMSDNEITIVRYADDGVIFAESKNKQ